MNCNDSFDRLPTKRKGSDFAHEAVVRKKHERQKLQGHSCKQCIGYYKSKGCSDEEIKKNIDQCSRHRTQYVRPDTPPNFWSVDFIDTQDFHNADSSKEKLTEVDSDTPVHRRRKPLRKLFQ